jgi:hypothetical protein
MQLRRMTRIVESERSTYASRLYLWPQSLGSGNPPNSVRAYSLEVIYEKKK